VSLFSELKFKCWLPAELAMIIVVQMRQNNVEENISKSEYKLRGENLTGEAK